MIDMRTTQFNTLKTFLIAVWVVLCSGLVTLAQAQSKQTTGLDAIAAIVNDDVITMRAVNRELSSVKREFGAQNIPLPDDETLQKQVLQRLITERLLAQQAAEFGIEVTDEDVARAVQMIAENNDLDRKSTRLNSSHVAISYA